MTISEKMGHTAFSVSSLGLSKYGCFSLSYLFSSDLPFPPSILSHFCIQTEIGSTMKHLRGKQGQQDRQALPSAPEKRGAASQVEEEIGRAVAVDNGRLTGLISNQRARGPSNNNSERCTLLKIYTP